MKSANIYLLVETLKSIVEAERTPNEKWLIVMREILVAPMFLLYAPNWEKNGFKKTNGKNVKHRGLFEEGLGYLRTLSSLGVTVSFDICYHQANKHAWNIADSYTNKLSNSVREVVIENNVTEKLKTAEKHSSPTCNC